MKFLKKNYHFLILSEEFKRIQKPEDVCEQQAFVMVVYPLMIFFISFSLIHNSFLFFFFLRFYLNISLKFKDPKEMRKWGRRRRRMREEKKKTKSPFLFPIFLPTFFFFNFPFKLTFLFFLLSCFLHKHTIPPLISFFVAFFSFVFS